VVAVSRQPRSLVVAACLTLALAVTACTASGGAAPGVYRRALAHFTEDELAEAFAATRGVASPTQLRASLRRDPRDLLGEFRALAPPRQPIALQRWGARRVVTVAAVLGVAVAAAYVAAAAFRPPVNLGSTPPVCGTGHAMILSAQAVPSSAMLPCIAALPSGWTADGADVGNGRAVFWLDSDQAGRRAVTVTLTAAVRQTEGLALCGHGAPCPG
jgi:hypothetical protein